MPKSYGEKAAAGIVAEMAEEQQLMKPEIFKKLQSLTLTTKLNVFGRHTDKLAVTMQGVSLEWDGQKVIVKDERVPDSEVWLLPAAIASMVWS